MKGCYLSRSFAYLGICAFLVGALTACSQSGKQRLLHHVKVQSRLATHQVLYRQILGSPRTLDPTLATGIPAEHVLDDLFEGLTTIGPHGSVVPGVAKSWTVSKTGLVWVFHLRSNARWSNGKPVTAHDFVFAWRREVNPETGSEYAQALAPIKNAMRIANGKAPVQTLGVRATNPKTLVVDLNHPTPYLPYLLTNDYLKPLYPPALKKWGRSWTRPGHMVSNGAFELKSHVINGHITLLKNPYYWGHKQVLLKRVIYYPISNPTTVEDQYLAGNIDFTYTFPVSDKKWLEKRIGQQVQIAPYFGTILLGFDLSRAPFKANRKLRQALSMAVDRDILAKYVRRGIGLPAYTLVPPLKGYRAPIPNWAKLTAKKRHAKALKLYHEAGYSKHHELTVNLVYPSGGAGVRRMMEALAAMWQMNLGAHIRIYNEQWKVYLQDAQMKRLRFFWDAWIGDYRDPYTFMQLFQTGFGMNYGDYSDARYDALLNEAQMTINPQKRFRLFEHAGRILNKDAPEIPLLYYESRHLIKPFVKGWHINIMDRELSKYMYVLAHKRQ